MLSSYFKIDFHINLEKRLINSNLFTELKSDHLELTYFCQAFKSKLIKISLFVGTKYFISSIAMTCACACEPLIVSRKQLMPARRATPDASEPIILYRSLYRVIVNSNKYCIIFIIWYIYCNEFLHILHDYVAVINGLSRHLVLTTCRCHI